MNRFGFNAIFAAALLAIFLGVWLWQSPGLLRGKLTQQEIARYLAEIEQTLPLPAEERPATLARVRAWAEADDGRPVYMLNLMRYHDTLRMVPGAPAFVGTPREANEIYESKVMPLLLSRGAYIMYAGAAQGKNLFGFEPELDDWSRVLLVRYPSRRAFLDMVTDPEYGPIEPYKLMALTLVLVPTSAELAVPEVGVATGVVLLLIFVTIGWIRAARRHG